MDHVSPRLVRQAHDRLKGSDVLGTPLVPLRLENTPGSIFLKLENLQPTGSFKVRGVSNAITLAGENAKKHGVYTVSAGNMAQALAWQAKERGIDCTVIVPDNAPETKLEGIKRYGARIISLTFADVWNVVMTHKYAPMEDENRVFIHPFEDPSMIAGNGTIGLELLDALPDVDSIIVPIGGGGLTAGIATIVKSVKPTVHVYCCEPESAAPFAASFARGSAQEIDRKGSFVDGIGGKSVLPGMWKLLRPLLEGSIVVSLRQIADALRILVERNRVVAEGAGAASVAASLTGKAGSGTIACIVSGGNIDTTKLVQILDGRIP